MGRGQSEPGVQGLGKDARQLPGVSPSRAVPVTGSLLPRMATPAHSGRLYCSFALAAHEFFNSINPITFRTIDVFFCYVVRADWILVDHNRRRYCGSAHGEVSGIGWQLQWSGPGCPPRIAYNVSSHETPFVCTLCVFRRGRLECPAARAPGRANGGCTPEAVVSWFLI